MIVMKRHSWTLILLSLIGCGSVEPISNGVAPPTGLVDDFEDLDLINHFGAMNAVFHDTLMPPSTINLQMTTAGSTLPEVERPAERRVSRA